MSAKFAVVNVNADQIKENEVGGTCGTHMGEERKVYRVLVGKPEGERPLGGPRCR
jgi:hypothetical protein